MDDLEVYRIVRPIDVYVWTVMCLCRIDLVCTYEFAPNKNMHALASLCTSVCVCECEENLYLHVLV